MEPYRRRPTSSTPWRGILLGIFLLVFVAGGAYSAKVFYASVRDVVAHYNLPAFSPPPGTTPERTGTPGQAEVQPKLTAQPKSTPAPPPTPGPDERVNFLLLGLDQRPGEHGPFRSDTMIVVSLDRKHKTASLISIPRDLWVPIPGYGENRINTAYFFGGPQLAQQTVQYNLGIPIHYYAVINFQGFERVVDTLDGITVDVPTSIYDTTYPDDDYGYQTVYIPAGRQRMNGDMALKYARVRHGASDFERMQRQQKVLLAIRNRAVELNYRLVPKLPSLWEAFGDVLDTDLSLKEALALVPLAVEVKADDIKMGAINSTMTAPFTTATGADVLWPDREKIGKFLEEILSSSGS